MTGRAKAATAAAAAASLISGTVVVANQFHSTAAPKGMLAQAVTNGCHSVPGKFWGTTWHYSPVILRPTRIETYCVTYPAAGGTLAKVSVAPVVLP